MCGKIIVIDGLDACGKHTQAELLEQRLREAGYPVKLFQFPEYDSLSSGPVRMYLNGEISENMEDINPYMASMFYAVDRAIQYVSEIKEYYESGYIIICDRYISSNLIYQSSRFSTHNEKKDYIDWLYTTECKLNGIPKDYTTICLTLPVAVSQKLMNNRYNGDQSKKDIHESSIEYLEKVRNNLNESVELANDYGLDWVIIDCSADGWIMEMEKISETIYSIVLDKIKD